MEDKKYTPEQLHTNLTQILTLSFTYLDRAMKDMAEFQQKDDKDLTPENRAAMVSVHSWMAILLDITHRAYPIVYDLFPQYTQSLDNALDMYKRFEKANFLRGCVCEFCKSKGLDAKPADVQSEPVIEAQPVEQVKADA